MMKAEVTAENRPACDPGQHAGIRPTGETHKYQGRVQILIICLVEFLVILLGHLVIILVESRTKIFRSRAYALLLTAGKFSATFIGA